MSSTLTELGKKKKAVPESVKSFGNFMKQAGEAFWKGIAFVWKYPESILGAWAVLWLSLIFFSVKGLGIPFTVTLVSAGMLNATSVIGLVIPLFALFVIFSKELVPAVWKALEEGFYKIFRKVKKEFEEAYKKIKELMKSIIDKIKDLIEKIKEFFEKMKKLVTEAFDKMKNAGKNAAKKVTKAVKKLLKAETDQVALSYQALQADLDRLDRVAPETTELTGSIRKTAAEAVGSVHSALSEDSHQYLGSWQGVDNLVNDLSQTLVSQYSALHAELVGVGDFR